MRLTFKYVTFALIATVANLCAQDVVTRTYYGAFALFISLGVGTFVGLFVKYVLDKHYIFRFQPRDAMHDGQTFVLYSVMGLVTTCVFWSFELGFDFLFKTKEMRYVGGAIGLGIGYLVKYRLDKLYVFRTEPT